LLIAIQGAAIPAEHYDLFHYLVTNIGCGDRLYDVMKCRTPYTNPIFLIEREIGYDQSLYEQYVGKNNKAFSAVTTGMKSTNVSHKVHGRLLQYFTDFYDRKGNKAHKYTFRSKETEALKLYHYIPDCNIVK
jgi:hypothetical protein